MAMKLTRLLSATSLLSMLTPVVASAAVLQPTGTERDQLLKVCANITDLQERPRCEARQIARWRLGQAKQVQLGLNAQSVYDDIDLGNGRIRRLTNENRRKLFGEEASQRKTYAEFEGTDDVNTNRLSYVNELRLERLRCHKDVPHGRARSLCLENAAQTARKHMEEYRQTQLLR